MRFDPLLVVLCIVAVTLSGCADGPRGPTEPTAVSGCVGEDCGDFNVGGGRGAISGLLIDDRLRPVQDAQILLLPLGLDTKVNENGEFGFVGLEPGTYTLKVSKEKHEAAPERVDVIAGQFTEAILEARRTVSENSLILAQEFSVFVPCAYRYVIEGYVSDCYTDRSGENYRASFTADYSGVPSVTWMVTEMKASQEAGYRVQVRNDASSGWERYASHTHPETDYIRIVNQRCFNGQGPDECGPNTEDNWYGDNKPWRNDRWFRTILFPLAEMEDELSGQYIPLWGNTCCGVGVRLGVRAQFVQSVFLGEPISDVDTYAVLN